MSMYRFVTSSLIAASVLAVGCAKQSESEPHAEQHAQGVEQAGGGGSESTHDEDASHDNGAVLNNPEHHDNQPEAHLMSKDDQAAAFAALITQALIDADTDTIIAHVKAVNLPAGWQQMIVPMLNGMEGYDLSGEVRERNTFTNEELKWPEETPEPLKAVTHILYVWYEGDDDSGNRTFPLVYENNQWKILLAG